MHWAAIGGHTEVVEFLLTLGIDANAQTSSGQTALHAAAEGEKVDVIKALVAFHELGKGKIDFELKDKDGKTAFDLAKDKKDKDMAKMIKFQKVDVSKEGGACSTS